MKKFIPFLIIATIFFIVSCQKELSYVVIETTSHNIISDFHNQNREEFQRFTVNAASYNSITAPQGAKIDLPANAFVTQDGRPVTGQVTVTVKEIYTPQEMIFNNMPTVSGNRLLESGGEFLISVSQQSLPLKLAPGHFIKISIPDIGRDMQGMEVFNGVADAAGNVDWVINTAPGNVVVRDSLLFTNTALFSDDINWINCDKFINDPTVTFTVNPGNAPSGDSTNVFVHLTGRNSVVKMNWTQGLNYFTSNMLLPVPSTIVGISVKEGKLFASIIPTGIQDNGSVTLQFSPYTEEQLKVRLSQLR